VKVDPCANSIAELVSAGGEDAADGDALGPGLDGDGSGARVSVGEYVSRGDKMVSASPLCTVLDVD
jgi:hypothetical protein